MRGSVDSVRHEPQSGSASGLASLFFGMEDAEIGLVASHAHLGYPPPAALVPGNTPKAGSTVSMRGDVLCVGRVAIDDAQIGSAVVQAVPVDMVDKPIPVRRGQSQEMPRQDDYPPAGPQDVALNIAAC